MHSGEGWEEILRGLRRTLRGGENMRWRRVVDFFLPELFSKLDRGFIEYGDDSFKQYPSKTLGEIKEELLDVVGWAVILWDGLSRLESDLQAKEDEAGWPRLDEQQG